MIFFNQFTAIIYVICSILGWIKMCLDIRKNDRDKLEIDWERLEEAERRLNVSRTRTL
jgi:hypothetical protein